jgi:YesN/AraC family two-component response regulator
MKKVSMDTHGSKPVVLSILYVDDDETTRFLLANILTMKYPGTQMFSADNGETGLELFRQHSPNIVITDITLHRMDGIQLATEIKRLDAATQIIILSGHSKEQYQSNLNEIDIRHFIQKPISFDQIFTAIEDSFRFINPMESSPLPIE